MPTENRCFDEILDVHALIQHWLAGEATTEQLSDLLAHFSPHFSMIGLNGQRLDHAGLQQLFLRAHGTRPHLVIQIDEPQLISLSQHLSLVSYRERQHDALGQHSVRRSTAVFESLADGGLRWLHLHETPCC
ncbi:DUF4440 domain-containing protein [Pseudomonas sp. BJa5]|uniref:DUF4440 domain-containing protein n=1 Tax=Pseudomonas sp. BJa5 TaxID=2936270 RepID=UPI00255A0DBA|nr:DUF4440 domain-containing protein [Pseudomonas sp. BGr12]MDL2419878.1 DUF4440 domain-containing protein [Pseudomonas sp. BGr12]